MGDSNPIEDAQELKQGQHGYEIKNAEQAQETSLAQEIHADDPAQKLDEPDNIQETPGVEEPMKTHVSTNELHVPDKIEESERVEEPLRTEGVEQDKEAQPAAKSSSPPTDPEPEEQPTPTLGPTQVSTSRILLFQKSQYLKDQSTFTVADEDEYLFDGDSAFGASSDVTDTVSLNSSLMRFREENGRKYHSFGTFHVSAL